MRAQSFTIFGLECTNEGRYLQLRIWKPNFTGIGHCLREFLLATGMLVSISLFTLAVIVWVATTVAEIDQASSVNEFRNIAVVLPESSATHRRLLSQDAFYALDEVHQNEQFAYADSHYNP